MVDRDKDRGKLRGVVRGVPVDAVEAVVGVCTGTPCIDAMSERGFVGSLIPPSRGGDCESLERGKLLEMGEGNDVGGALPDE